MTFPFTPKDGVLEGVLERANNRLVELGIFQRKKEPVGSYYFSDEYREYYNKALKKEILAQYEANPNLGPENFEDVLVEPEGIQSLISMYLEENAPGTLKSITDAEMKDFVMTVRAMYLLQDRDKVNEDLK